MDKKQVAKKLIKKGLINNISELDDLFYRTSGKKPEKIGYAYDCKCAPNCTLDIRIDLQGSLFKD